MILASMLPLKHYVLWPTMSLSSQCLWLLDLDASKISEGHLYPHPFAYPLPRSFNSVTVTMHGMQVSKVSPTLCCEITRVWPSTVGEGKIHVVYWDSKLLEGWPLVAGGGNHVLPPPLYETLASVQQRHICDKKPYSTLGCN